AHTDLHSFPTRRSSDLQKWTRHLPLSEEMEYCAESRSKTICPSSTTTPVRASARNSWIARASSSGVMERGQGGIGEAAKPVRIRSEEHTSELQSPYDLV